MDGRLWIILIVALCLWVANVPNQRRLGSYNKIRIPILMARLVGSRNEYVDWRSLSFQLGAVVFFLSQFLLTYFQVEDFMLYGGVITMTSVLLSQAVFISCYRHKG